MAEEIESIGSSVRAPPVADCLNEIMVDRAGADWDY